MTAIATAIMTITGGAQAAGINITTTTDWNTGVFTSTNTNPPPNTGNGHVRLNDSIVTPFNQIWVALSGRDSVVRINTNVNPATIGNGDSTLTEAEAGGPAVVGEYLTHPNGMAGNPSRTTVDLDSDVWVGNRNESSGGLGSITKITHDPAGTTSTGVWNGGTFDRLAWPNTGSADSNGGGSTAVDTAIVRYVRTTGANVRHVSVNANNEVWAGGGPLDTGDQVFQLYSATGVLVPDPDGPGPQVTTFPDNNTGGYGGLVDCNGVLWSAGLNGNTLSRMVPATGARMTVNQSNRQSYGMGIDNNGFIWNATWTNNTVDKIDPNGIVVASYNLSAYGNSFRGVAVTPDNDVWVAASGSNRVIRVNNNGTVQSTINVGATPTGLAVDSNGKLWVTNYDSNSVMRIDPAGNAGNGAVDLTIRLGANANPYNYSDMTGTVLYGTTASSGAWSKVLDGGAGAQWTQIFWNQESEGSIPANTAIVLEARFSNDQISWTTYLTHI